MNSLGEAFAAAAADDRALLIGYLPAGFPSRTEAVAIIAAMVENGVDVVEVGLPYSDPLMDGPVIQAAVDQALAGGARISDVLATVRGTVAAGAPALVMSYWNPIEKYGVERFATELSAAGGIGVITPDLTPEEGADWCAATEAHEIDRVFLVAPSSTDERIAAIADATTGFVYAASTMGVTGVRASVSNAAEDLVARVRQATRLPVCVGVGVSNAEQAAQVARYADGVIVGSAFIRAVQEADSDVAARDAVGRLASELAVGVRRR
ncbi:MAG: tryptophan synthase subunit alpha [Actinobacteria bacterium]|nr:tryptophan synthase subunit alpha [Actinomycetota bacterium]